MEPVVLAEVLDIDMILNIRSFHCRGQDHFVLELSPAEQGSGLEEEQG